MGLHHLQEITALLAFGPKPVLASRKEGNTPFMLRLLPRFFVHVAQHQHLEGLCILYDGRDQATTLFEVYLFVHLFSALCLSAVCSSPFCRLLFAFLPVVTTER